MSKQKVYNDGEYESVKFAHRRKDYQAGLQGILELGYSNEDLIHHFSAFTGHMTLWKTLTLYELYKKTQGICGHIAEVGVDKGASTLLFGKLTQIFEPEALTLVHGFDWFRGAIPTEEEKLINASDGNPDDEQQLRELIRLQKLDNIVKIHNVDVATEMDKFFAEHPQLRFKLVYLDCGIYPVVESAIKAFWPRLAPGGIMIFDQYNNELAPGETRAVSELLPDYKIETIPGSWFPNAYVVKPFIGQGHDTPEKMTS